MLFNAATLDSKFHTIQTLSCGTVASAELCRSRYNSAAKIGNSKEIINVVNIHVSLYTIQININKVNAAGSNDVDLRGGQGKA